MPLLSIEQLKDRLSALFMEAGLNDEESAVVADIILTAECNGRRSHGLIRVAPMLRHLSRYRHRRGRWLRETRISALYDGLGGLGYLVAYECTKKAIELATDSQVAVVGARGATHTGPIGYFARLCALRGLIGIILANCSAMAAPFGATSPVLGTNPIAFGFPYEPEPVVVDLGTTAITYGECRVAINEGRPLPEGVALDSNGEPTTDPEAAIKGGALLPFGGHKGYALALAIQIMTSALTGASAVPEPGKDYGFTVIAMRRDILVDSERYIEVLDELVRAVKSARPKDPKQPVLIPGERSAARWRKALANGIELSQSLYDELFGKNAGTGT